MQTQMKVIALSANFNHRGSIDVLSSEVVTLLIVNSEPFTPGAFDSVFKTVGLDRISFIPQSPTIALSEWPTLDNMLNTNQRLVIFLDRGADFTVAPYIIDGTNGSCLLYL
jgi:hypothetical protein